MESDFKSRFADAAARVFDLEEENEDLALDNAFLRQQTGQFLQRDDGSYAYCSESTGGAHPLGINSLLHIVFVDADGNSQTRTYVATDKISEYKASDIWQDAA